MLSIVVPTLNEEKCLPLLLESIKRQKLDEGFEVVVADAGSVDNTREIALKEGCKVVDGGFPPKGKNNGALFARGDLVLFADADIILPEKFLEHSLEEFKKRKLDAASFYLKAEDRFHNFLFNLLYNFPVKVSGKVFPQAMNIILIKKELHEKFGGFDEEIKLGEELDYVRKAARLGKFGVIKSTRAVASVRRYKQDGWFQTWFKYLLCQLHMIFIGPVKSDIFRYKFNHYLKD